MVARRCTAKACLLQALDALQTELGYHFREIRLLKLAIMHVSASDAAINCLSWLGDSLMHIMTTEAMTLAYPQHTIGELSPIRANLVSRSHLAR